MNLLQLCMFLFGHLITASAQCVDESPIPPIVPPTSWTAWYSVDDPWDGTDDETHAAVQAAFSAVCDSPTLSECRVKYLHTDHLTAGQILATSCSATGGLLCRQTDQTNLEPCLDYEIRFECPSPIDMLPLPHFYWDLSTKTSIDADEPVTCDGPVSSIYPNIGGMAGSVMRTMQATDGFDSSDHLCAAAQNQAAPANGYVDFGSMNDKCMSEPACCTSGFTMSFWIRNRIPPTDTRVRHILSIGAETGKSKGFVVYLHGGKTVFAVRGYKPSEHFAMEGAAGYPDVNQWSFCTFTFELDAGIKYYKNGVLEESANTTTIDGAKTQDRDSLIMFSRSWSPSNYGYFPDVDMSDFKMFYRFFNATEVQTLYLQDTQESKLVIHYLRKHSHDDSFGVELECLAKAGTGPPTITWHRSDDGANFEPVSPSVDVAIYESSPNSYRRRSVLIVRHLRFTSDVIFACEAYDAVRGGRLSRTVTLPKRGKFWSPWLSADSPVDGDDIETLTRHRQGDDRLCKYPSDIQCRTVYDDVPSNQTGQILNINCTVASGLECLGSDQSDDAHTMCYDYAVRYKCSEPRFYWTPWYDASTPDGTMEDETFTTHTAQSYPDLCAQPIGAECRVKSNSQDLLASVVVPDVPYLCNANGFRCQYADNAGSCPDMEVRYRCPYATPVTELSINSLLQQSHHLDPILRLTCDATIGSPQVAGFSLGWAYLDPTQPYASTSLSAGGAITILTVNTLIIEDFPSSLLANKSLVCIVRDGIIIDAETIDITLPSMCERPLGVSNGNIDVTQITPSTIKTLPFKVPGVNGPDPWVPASTDTPGPTLDFDFGIDFTITGVAIQGDPIGQSPTSLVTQFSLKTQDSPTDPWNLYTDSQGDSNFDSDYRGGTASSFITYLVPNTTTRFLRFLPDSASNVGSDVMMRVEIYGCAVGESTLQILQLTKQYGASTNNFTFTCRAEHYPLPVITWLADNVTISPQEGSLDISNVTDVFPTTTSILTLIGFHPDNDSVTFTCEATAGGKVKTASISTDFTFHGSVSVSGNPVVNFGSDVIMTCSASGDVIYVMEWGHRQASTNLPFVILRSGGRFVILQTKHSATNWDSTLTIRQFDDVDDGEYACLVNLDTARDSITVKGKSGLRAGWTNVTYDEKTNSYNLECAVFYTGAIPDVMWVTPSGQKIGVSSGQYQIQSELQTVAGNLTKISTMTIHGYTYLHYDGEYTCSCNASGQGINMTIQTQYAFDGTVSASSPAPIVGSPVSLNCLANHAGRVYHAVWLRVVGMDRAPVVPDSRYTIDENRSGGMFRLSLGIGTYSPQLDDGYYVCSINNGTGEDVAVLSGPLGHGHSHGGCSGGHDHDHDHDPPDRGTEFSLYTKINTDQVECLNEVTDGSGKLVFKPWDQRLDVDKYVESDDDEELLFNIPFTGNVKLKGVIVIGGNEDSHPAEMRLYKNQANMTFDDTHSKPDQVFEMQKDSSGILEYNTKIARFSNVNHLSIHFSKNFGAETSIVYYIGLRGEFTEARRQEIMIAQYEAYANPKDHKTSLTDNVQQQIS